jgi:hypothetical protein
VAVRKNALSNPPSAQREGENRKLKKPWKEKKRKRFNLILSHINHIFFILDPWIWPQAFRHTHCTLRKSVF